MKSKEKPSFYTSPLLSRMPGLFHGFGTKGFVLRRKAGEKRFRPVTLRQVHSDSIVHLDRPPRSKRPGDALATSRRGLLVAVKTADCLPLLLADPEKRVVAAVHCGWRGTAAGLAEKTVRSLGERYGCRPANLRAALGPSIASGCYEVGGDVRLAFRTAGLPSSVFRRRPRRPGKFSLDLASAVVFQLKRAGLRAKHIDRLPLCTHCRPELCSFRRDPRRPDRMINFIGFLNSRSVEKKAGCLSRVPR